MTERSPEEKEALTMILLHVGANWKASIIPEDELNEAVNEFLSRAGSGYKRLIEDIRNGKIKLHVADKRTRDRTGYWLSLEDLA